jgi:hypothetical protein
VQSKTQIGISVEADLRHRLIFAARGRGLSLSAYCAHLLADAVRRSDTPTNSSVSLATVEPTRAALEAQVSSLSEGLDELSRRVAHLQQPARRSVGSVESLKILDPSRMFEGEADEDPFAYRGSF